MAGGMVVRYDLRECEQSPLSGWWYVMEVTTHNGHELEPVVVAVCPDRTRAEVVRDALTARRQAGR